MSEEAIQDTGSQEVAADAAVEAAPSFLESLPEDLRNEPSLRTFTDPSALAKSYVSAQRLIGSDKIGKPQSSWTSDQWGEFYAAAGRPEGPNGYELQVDKGVFGDGSLEGLRTAAHEAGLNGTQAQRMAEFLQTSVTNIQRGFEEQADSLRQEGEMELRQEYGKAFEQKVDMARSAAVQFLGNIDLLDEIQLADGRMLGDHPEVIRMFSRIAEGIGEDNLEGDPTELIMTPEEASRQLTEVMRRDGPYFDKTHPEHDAYVREATRLFEFR
jgi:hypothetical protein